MKVKFEKRSIMTEDAGKSPRAKSISIITILLALTVLFPEVGWYSSTDVQPNFFILSILSTLVFLGRIRVSAMEFLYFTVCMMFLLLSFIVHQENITWLYMLKYSISLLSFFLCYLLCSNKIIVISNKLITYAVILYILVGYFQFIIPDFLTSLVTRKLTTADLASTGRGMMSLTGEPSHFGKVITILNVLYVFNSLLSNNQKVKHRSLVLITILLFVLNCFLSQSLYACFFHLICLLGIFYILSRQSAYIFAILTFFSLVSAISAIEAMFPTSRIAVLANALIVSPEILLNQGAVVRALNVPLTFVTLSHFGLWGSGNSSLIVSSQVDVGIGLLAYTTSNRLYGGFVEYILKMGLLSIPIVIGYIYLMVTIGKIKLIISGVRRSVGVFFSGILILLSLQDGSLASPLMIFAVVCMFLKAKTSLTKPRWRNSSLHSIDSGVSGE